MHIPLVVWLGGLCLLSDQALVSWIRHVVCYGMSWFSSLFPLLSCPNSGFVGMLPGEGYFHFWFGWLSNSWFIGFSRHLFACSDWDICGLGYWVGVFSK